MDAFLQKLAAILIPAIVDEFLKPNNLMKLVDAMKQVFESRLVEAGKPNEEDAHFHQVVENSGMSNVPLPPAP